MQMKKNIRYLLVPAVFVLIIGTLTLSLYILPDKDISEWERRRLQQFPDISVSSLTSGKFMRDFETYLADQFPLRDSFRTLKAKFHFNVLLQKDNNDIYLIDGSAGSLDRKIFGKSVENFTQKITALYDTYVKDTECKAFFSLIPDKSFYLTEGTVYPHYDFDEIEAMTLKLLPDLEKIDIYPLLSAASYYTTDSHWKQEEIIPVANLIRKKLGMKPLSDLEKKDAGEFYGVYYGQSALPIDADRLCYMTNGEIDSCTVKSAESKNETKVYNLDKLTSLDRYDIFLSGAVSVAEIINPSAETDRELIIFRDSFGSSLAPLLVPGYSKVTLIDTRYIVPEMIDDFVTFDSQDVLFIYSTGIVNKSTGLK